MTKDEYEICVMRCANDRILVDVFNMNTGESIRIDETYKDVKKLYEVLKVFFEEGEK